LVIISSIFKWKNARLKIRVKIKNSGRVRVKVKNGVRLKDRDNSEPVFKRIAQFDNENDVYVVLSNVKTTDPSAFGWH